jgi:hypothetical protein
VFVTVTATDKPEIADERQATVLSHVPDSWDNLKGSAAGPMHERNWAVACIEAFELEPFIVAVGPPEKPYALAPLALVHGRLEAIGVRELFEPMDFLASDEEAALELVEALARLRVPLLLRRLPNSSLALPLLRKAWRRALVVERPMSSCPVLALDEGWVDPESRLSSRRRSDLRRARRRAGHVEAEVLTPTVEETPALVELALAIEMRSWKGRNGTAILQNPVRSAFFRRYCELAAAAGSLRLAFLRVDGDAAAMQIAVERDDAYWLLKIGYDEKFSRCSPGQLLIAHSIGWAATRGLSAYEFLGTAEPWIDLWTESQRPCTAIGVYLPGPRSAVAAARDAREFAQSKLHQRKRGEQGN